jgi:hypothetical protein
MKSWRWPSWAILVWACIAVVVSAGIVMTAQDANQAGYTVGQLTWIWIIGFVVLAVVRRSTRPTKTCPQCRWTVDASAPACPRCGYYPAPSQPPVFK